MKFSKTVGLTDIGVTIATHWWRHAFHVSPIFSKSGPKLLKWSYAPCRLHIDLFEVLKNSMRAFSNKSGLNIFYEKMKDSPWFMLIRQASKVILVWSFLLTLRFSAAAQTTNKNSFFIFLSLAEEGFIAYERHTNCAAALRKKLTPLFPWLISLIRGSEILNS